MSRPTVQPSQCTPYFCNEFHNPGNGKCTICNERIKDKHTFQYPVPAGSAFGIFQNSPRKFTAFNVEKVVPSDMSSGKSHQYAHKQCMHSAGKTIDSPHDPLPFKWTAERGKKQRQTEVAHTFLKDKMGITDPKSYNTDGMAFLQGIGDMGLMHKELFNHKPPMATAYRIFEGTHQCMEFVHFDKFYGMKMNPDATDTSERCPLIAHYHALERTQREMAHNRSNGFHSIYTGKKFIDHFNLKTKMWEVLSLAEYEALWTKGFGPDTIFVQQRHHGLLDTTYRWWNEAFTFRILIDGVDVGLVEFKIMDNYSRKDKLHQGKSLFIYNVIGHKKGLRLLPYVFWFAKVLALHMNRFSDIRTYDQDDIKQVYLTTSSTNPAMNTHAGPCNFTEVVTKKVHWDRDYFWNVPYVPTHNKGVDQFPTNIVAWMAPETYIPSAFYCSRNNILDKTLLPTAAETVIFTSNTLPTRASRGRLTTGEPYEPPVYKFSAFYAHHETPGHTNELESDGEVPETPSDAGEIQQD